MAHPIPVVTELADLDPFDDAVLADPYPVYRRLRDAGPVVLLRRHGVVAVSRYAEVREALRDWRTFSSASGVGLTEEFNELPGGILGSDPPEHDRLRRVLQGRLSPRALRSVDEVLQARADALVDAVVERGWFDAVRDLAEPYATSVVADLAGLPGEGRADLPANSRAAFDRFGPRNQRFATAAPGFARLVDYVVETAVPGRLGPGGAGEEIYAAAKAGTVRRQECPGMLLAYTWPGVDTTVNAIGTAVHLFARYPEQWGLVRDRPDLVPAAAAEALRLESPVQFVARVATRGCEIGGVPVAAGQRVILIIGSANRDERRYADPDRFDVRRDPGDHLAFGHGVHLCVGAGLARRELHAVLRSLARRVSRFRLVHAERRLNNVTRGLATLHVDVAQDDSCT
jgi:cytochrome P450